MSLRTLKAKYKRWLYTSFYKRIGSYLYYTPWEIRPRRRLVKIDCKETAYQVYKQEHKRCFFRYKSVKLAEPLAEILGLEVNELWFEFEEQIIEDSFTRDC